MFFLCNALAKLRLYLDTQQKCELFSQNCHLRTQNKDTQVLIRLELMNRSPACCELQKCQVTPVDKQWPQSSENKAFFFFGYSHSFHSCNYKILFIHSRLPMQVRPSLQSVLCVKIAGASLRRKNPSCRPQTKNKILGCSWTQRREEN